MWLSHGDLVGWAIGILGCAVSLLIAVRQHRETAKLERISEDTRQVAKAIRGGDYRRKVVDAFFQLDSRSHIRCFLPCSDDGRVLPSIKAGDYYVLHVLQSLWSEERLMICPQGPADDGRECLQDGDSFFICTPQANVALRVRAPFLEDGGEMRLWRPQIARDVDLPCWFGNSHQFDEDGVKKETKVIIVTGNDNPLPSPSEKENLRCVLGQRCRPLDPVQRDLAILFRITLRNGCKQFAAAGIHQYGTWIAGEFLNRLSTEGHPGLSDLSDFQRQVILGQDDFLAILWGEFDTRTYTVGNIGVHQSYIWARRKGNWEMASTPDDRRQEINAALILLGELGASAHSNPDRIGSHSLNISGKISSMPIHCVV